MIAFLQFLSAAQRKSRKTKLDIASTHPKSTAKAALKKPPVEVIEFWPLARIKSFLGRKAQ